MRDLRTMLGICLFALTVVCLAIAFIPNQRKVHYTEIKFHKQCINGYYYLINTQGNRGLMALSLDDFGKAEMCNDKLTGQD